MKEKLKKIGRIISTPFHFLYTLFHDILTADVCTAIVELVLFLMIFYYNRNMFGRELIPNVFCGLLMFAYFFVLSIPIGTICYIVFMLLPIILKPMDLLYKICSKDTTSDSSFDNFNKYNDYKIEPKTEAEKRMFEKNKKLVISGFKPYEGNSRG